MFAAFFNNIAIFFSDIRIQQIFPLDFTRSAKLIILLALVCILPLVGKRILSAFSVRPGTGNTRSYKHKNDRGGDLLKHEAAIISNGCTNCGTCVKECAFLQEYGTPGAILKTRDISNPDFHSMAFECTQCHLCSEVCPDGLQPGKLFHAARRQAMGSETVSLKPYRKILEYEKHGGSPLFSFWGLPEGCNTVLFPGCTLPGTRPETTWQMFSFLKRHYPNLGVVLDCCGKSSHDLGCPDRSEQLLQKLKSKGVQKILVACPSCHGIFKAHAREIKVQTVYEVISDSGLPDNQPVIHEEVVVHDPCRMRRETRVQDAVRNILIRRGLKVKDVVHQREKTVCCGEGGCAGFVRPDLADQWSRVRHNEASGCRIITYCAGCAKFLGRTGQTDHIADIVFSKERHNKAGFNVSKSPATYVNRIRLKRRFSHLIKAGDSHSPS